VAKVLNHPAPAAIDPQQGLFEMGMDSLMSVELKGRLQRGTGLTLPATLTFNYPNIAALTAYLTERLQPAEPDAPTPAPVVDPAPTPAAETGATEPVAHDALSDEELTALLFAKLEQLS
jgi:acyl carrier protein